MRLPFSRIVGSASLRCWPRSTKVSKYPVVRRGSDRGRWPSGAKCGKMLHGLFNTIVGDIVGSRLSAQEEVITHVLLDEPVAVMAADDDGIGEIQVSDHGLQLAAIMLAHLAAEDGGDLIGLADGAIGIQEALSQSIQRSTPMEDEIVEIFHLSKEQPMLTPRLLAFGFGKEGGEIGQPLLAAR